MPKLITYTRGQYPTLRAKVQEGGRTLLSAAELQDSDMAREISQHKNAVVDVSTLLPLFDQETGFDLLSFQLELLCHRIDDSAEFIADEDVANKYAYGCRTLFDVMENCGLSAALSADGGANTSTVELITALDDDKLSSLLKKFEEKLIGQPTFKEALRDEIGSFRLFNKLGEQPILSMLLIGPSGVGKTETARILGDLLAPDQPLPKINFGNYSSKDSLNSLIGSPRGYIGSDIGELSMKLKSSFTGVLLIDEFEKADAAVWNFFHDLLESGKYTDSQGDRHDLNGYIIVFTSNEPRSTVHEKFPAELMSRINLKVNFDKLSNKEKRLFVERYISRIVNKYITSTSTNTKAEDIVSKALAEIPFSDIDNIRILKNESRKWLAKHIG